MSEKRRWSIGNFLRRKTPKPGDRKVFNLGIQERESNYLMTTPLLYNVAYNSVITRTCITQLKNDVVMSGEKTLLTNV